MGRAQMVAMMIVGILLGSGMVSAEPSPGESGHEVTFPWVGEGLYYSVRINGAEAMRAGLRTGEVRRSEGNRSYIPLNALAQSRGFFNAVYPLNDRANTFLEPESFFPLRTEKVFDEAGKRRSYFVDYRLNSFEARVEREREDRRTTFTAPVPGSTHDMLTWMYALRGRHGLAIGEAFSFYIYDGWLVSRLDLEVVGAEDVLTPMGWFKTWKVSFARSIVTVRSGGEDEAGRSQAPSVSMREEARHAGHLWFSRDENLLPVRATISTMLGSGEAVLVRYQPGERR